MNEPILHVTFCQSGAGVLKVALAKAARSCEVISLMDNLSFGPIEYSNFSERRVWIEQNLFISGYEEVVDFSRLFWDKITSDKRRKILWTSKRSAMEYAGFLECLWRLGDTPCSMIDLSDVKIVRNWHGGKPQAPDLAICLGLTSEQDILKYEILDMAKPISAQDREYYQSAWKKLRSENAPFRIVNEHGMTSAPITCFDDEVLSCVKQEWQKSARVIGEVMGKEWPFQYIQTGDGVYFSRLQKLVENGVVESRGDMSKMRTSEVRLPVKQSDKTDILKA